MKDRSRKTLFALFVVAVMLCMPFTMIEQENDAAGMTDVLPIGKTYGYRITTGEITSGGYTGNGIKGVEYGGSDKNMVKIYEDTTYGNLLYNNNSVNSSSTNPKFNDLLRFDEKTGLGPFNSFYVALNIGDTRNNGDLYKTSYVPGQIAYILNPYNLEEAIITDGTTKSAYSGTDNYTYYTYSHPSDYNIMLFIPTVYWYSDDNHLWLSNRQDYFTDDGVSPQLMEARAHTIDGQIRPYLGLGVYEASQSGSSLVSQSGKTPLNNKSVAQFRDMVNNLNTEATNETGEYMIWNYYQWTLYKMMSYTVIGTKNSQLAIGQGATLLGNGANSGPMTTGLGDDQGPYWGGLNSDGSGSYKDGKHSVKLFLENTWGSYHDLLDDVWIGEGQLHAGQNSIGNIIDHILYPSTSGTDAGLNDNQELIENAIFPNPSKEYMLPIQSTSSNPEYWDFPTSVNENKKNYLPIGDNIQYRAGYQTLCVGGHYDGQSAAGLNRMNIRNGFGDAKSDIGTRIAYVTYGGILTYDETSEYRATSSYGDIPSGYSLFKGVEVNIVPAEGKTIYKVILNGVALEGTSFLMPAMDVKLVILTDNILRNPNAYTSSDNVPVVGKFIYDGKYHTGLMGDDDVYTITGQNNAKDAGLYEITVTPKEGLEWWDHTTGAKTFKWVIEKKTLVIEGASSAEISKIYDGTRNLGTDSSGQVKPTDLFMHGLVSGEVPNISATAKYSNAEARSNKVIDVTALSLSDSDTFCSDNYVYNFKKFEIRGSKVTILPKGLSSMGDDLQIEAIEDQVYTGELITPSPEIRAWGNVLVLGTDYTLSFTNNIAAGTATMKVEGKGNFNKSVTRTFEIVKKEISWPAVLETPYNGEQQSADLVSNFWYEVVSEAQGTAVGSYNATLRINDPINVKWADSDQVQRQGEALRITDVDNQLTFVLLGAHWANEYSAPLLYKSSQSLQLPGADKITPYLKTGYDVTFLGWYETGDENKTLITQIPAGSLGSKSFTALFSEERSTYTVSFSSEFGTQIPQQNVKYGDLVNKPADPTTSYYIFKGWYRTYSQGVYSNPWNFDTDTVAGNMTLYAMWKVETCTVVWKNYDGTVLETDNEVALNSTPVFNSSNPTRATDEHYVYTFSGWSPQVGPVTGNTVYTATYSTAIVPYNINIPANVAYDVVTVSGTNPAEYGTSYVFKINPNPSQPQFSQLNGLKVTVNYTGGGSEILVKDSDGNFTISNITKPADVTITLTINMYSASWLDKNGDSIYTSITRPYETPVAEPGTPDGPSNKDVSMNYTFQYWSVGSYDSSETITNMDGQVLLSDKVYYAHFTETVKTFRITYSGSDVFTLNPLNGANINAIPYGSNFQFTLTIIDQRYSQVPSKATAQANGQPVQKSTDNVFTVSSITADTNLDFTGISFNGYNVYWLREDGTQITVDSDVKHDTHPNAPAYPAQTTSSFKGWKIGGEGSIVNLNEYTMSGDVTFRAYSEYTVTFNCDNGLECTLTSPQGASGFKVPYGSSLTSILSYPEGKRAEYILSVNGVKETNDPAPMGMTFVNNADGMTTTYTIPSVTTDVVLRATLSYDLFTVDWKDGDTILMTEHYRSGSTPVAPFVPTKDPITGYHYVFNGWKLDSSGSVVDLSGVSITSDMSIFADFSQVVNQYTITLPDADIFTVVPDSESNVVTHGSSYKFKITANPSAPKFSQLRNLTVISKGSTEQNITSSKDSEGYYWISNITEAKTILVDLTINVYTIQWQDENGATLYPDKYAAHDTSIIVPGTPEKPVVTDDSKNYSFTGWTKYVGSEWVPVSDPNADVALSSTVYRATFASETKVFKIIYSGSTTFTVNPLEGMNKDHVNYGDSFSFRITANTDEYSQVPDKIEVLANGTKVSKSDGVFTISNITADQNLGFTKIDINGYTVTWKDANGDTISTVNDVKHGSVPVAPDMTYLNNAQYTYTVAWTKNSGTAPVNLANEVVIANVTYNAVLTQSVNKYTVVWKNWDETVLETDSEAEYGSIPHYDSDTPARAQDDLNRYNFLGWTPEVIAVTGNVIYTAMFETVNVAAYVTWMNPDGEILQNSSVALDEIPEFLGGTPAMTPTAQYTYNFLGWTPEVTAVTGNITYTAQYDEVLNEYKVTWVNQNGTVLKQETLTYGATPAYSGTPTMERDGQYTYTFREWTPAISNVEGDSTYFAVYDTEVNKYTVTWKNWDGTILRTQSIPYGTTPSYSGITPIKATPVDQKHSWNGWSPEIVPVTGDATYTATFDSHYFDVRIKIVSSDSTLGSVLNAGTYTVKSNASMTVSDIDTSTMGTDTPAGTLSISGLDKEFGAIANNSSASMVSIFVGWYIGSDMVPDGYQINGQNDLEITAMFAQIPADYSVLVTTSYGSETMATFDENGGQQAEVISLIGIPLGTRIDVNENGSLTIGDRNITMHPNNTGYRTVEFVKWEYILSGQPVRSGDRVDEMTVIGVVVEVTTHKSTITWNDYDDSQLRQDILYNGTTPVYGLDPIRPGDDDAVYTFDGWQPDVAIVTGDATYKAKYSSNTNTAVITVDLNGAVSTLVNEGNGWILDYNGYYQKKFENGTSLNFGEVTIAQGLDVFHPIRWTDSIGATVEPGEVTGFAFYRAEFTWITWADYDGEILDKEVVEPGAVPSHADPIRADDPGIYYQFDHWEKGGMPVTLSEETVNVSTTYMAQYSMHYKSYTVTFNANGGTSLSFPSKTVTFNSTYGDLPTASWPGYTFNGWYDQEGYRIYSNTVFNEVQDQTLTAHWSIIPVDPVDPEEPKSSISKETIMNADGSITERITETIQYSDGYKRVKVTETTKRVDDSTQIVVTDVETDKNGASMTHRTQKDISSDGSFESTNTVTFSSGDWVTGHTSGDSRSETPTGKVEFGYSDSMSNEQADMVEDLINDAISSDKNPEVVIISETPVSVPESIISDIIQGDGSLTFIEGGKELYLTAKTLKGMSLTSIDRLSIRITDDIPQKYRTEAGITFAYDIRMEINHQEYHEQFSEPVKVTIPYKLKEGQSVDSISVLYLGEELEKLEFTYDGENVVFYLSHMSLYSIVSEDPEPVPVDPTDEGEFPVMYIAIAAVILVAIAAVAVWIKR
ncbi:InlB B-repeat-containing protein [Methanomassiliicoccales archaeon LGM-RCC1]|nr:InlB B-repeat-containing protein [Methanomassiliicoccales archaeon LGM-RCC1]